MIFDTHTHYDDRRFDEDRGMLLDSLSEKGVAGIAAIGADLESSEASLALAKEYPFILAAVGVHPDRVSELEEEKEQGTERLRRLMKDPRCAAVGEIGLDYHGDFPGKPSRFVQQYWFSFQLEMAKKEELPIVIHSRDAAADTLSLIREAGGSSLSMVHHCFGYEKETAKLYLDMGHFLGIGGVVTYKNGRKLKEVVQYMPLDRILLETDCPYLPPEPFRGRRNDSTLLSYVVSEIARLKQISEEEVETITCENAMRFYRLAEREKNEFFAVRGR